MGQTIQYYFAPNSPWTYLGHQRFWDMARSAGVTIELIAADLRRVFAATGGLPLAKRAPQRQAYRLAELRRFSQWLKLPLTLHPRYFPVAANDAALLVIAVAQHDGSDAAMGLGLAMLRAVWVQERNLADAATLAALLSEQGLAPQRLDDSRAQVVSDRYDANTERAIAAGVFGAPTYVIDGEMFWGQDRLDFVQRLLTKG